MPGTRLIGYRELRQQYDLLGPEKTTRHLTESLENGDLKPEDFSIRELAESMVDDGREWVNSMDPRKAGSFHLMEADAVNTAAFSNITGQIVYTRMIEEFMSEAFVFSAIVPSVPTRFDGEKIPGIAGIGDTAEIVDEADPYPVVGVGEDWIETPVTTKRGHIVPVTKEAIFFDRTGMLLRKAGQVGEFLGLNKEKRVIDCLIDENSTAHRYKWRGTVIATYGDNSGDHNWDNLAATNALDDWTNVEAAELLLAAITDPNTGEPVIAEATHLIVQPGKLHTAKRINNATNVVDQIGGFATTGNLTRFESANPLKNYTIASSRLLQARTGTDTDWWLGAPAKAFAYMENWPITVVTAPANSDAEFNRDIVTQYKASERGAAATLEPRLMVENNA